MFHLELRQFPHVSRAFNLTREELDLRFARPWISGQLIEHEDRRWSPERARLTILEGPALALDEIGLGRGWATAGKSSRDVTETVLAEARRGAQGRPEIEGFKSQLRVAAAQPLALAEVAQLAAAQYSGWRASECLALAEQAVWELLHHNGLTLWGPDGRVAQSSWQAIVVAWSSWAGDEYRVQTTDS